MCKCIQTLERDSLTPITEVRLAQRSIKELTLGMIVRQLWPYL